MIKMSETDLQLKKLHDKLNSHIEEQSKNWKSFVYAKQNGFYQGFDEIKINGCRSTEKRFKEYKIEKFFDKNFSGLDIGSNCGFFTIYVSRYLGSIDGVEINPYLVKIANDTKDFLKINNVNYYTSSFEEFKPKHKYDLVFSLANDETVDGLTKFTFTEYVQKIVDLLNEHGILAFESQASDTYYIKKFEPKLEILKNNFHILEQRIVKSEYPANVPKRYFLILQRK